MWFSDDMMDFSVLFAMRFIRANQLRCAQLPSPCDSFSLINNDIFKEEGERKQETRRSRENTMRRQLTMSFQPNVLAFC